MSKKLGYAILALGCSSVVILWNIEDSVPLKELWFVFIFFLFVFGLFILVKNRFQELDEPDDYYLKEFQRLRVSGEKIKMTLQNCEVKDRSYQKEISKTNSFSQTALLDALYDSDRLSSSEVVRMVYIVFYKKYDSSVYKFVSRGMSITAEELIRRIDTEPGIYLYVDKADRTKYFFDV